MKKLTSSSQLSLTGIAPPATSLLTVLEKSEHVKDLVEQSAKELTAVNLDLAREMTFDNKQSEPNSTLIKSQAVEVKVQDAADKLSDVNLALEEEVNKRHALERQLKEITQDEKLARHAALHDPLTGLPNRDLFDDRLSQGLSQAKRHERTLAVMFLDLDKFKLINDHYGHDVGDAVLTTVADRLKENTRQDDTVCRIGGDEFLFLLADFGTLDDVSMIAEKITMSLSKPCLLAAGQIEIGVSMGIAIFPKDGDTAQGLIKKADQAMYAAKGSPQRFKFAS